MLSEQLFYQQKMLIKMCKNLNFLLTEKYKGYIVYAGIVSAPAEAWKGVKHKDDSFHGIGIYALDKGHMSVV